MFPDVIVWAEAHGVGDETQQRPEIAGPLNSYQGTASAVPLRRMEARGVSPESPSEQLPAIARISRHGGHNHVLQRLRQGYR